MSLKKQARKITTKGGKAIFDDGEFDKKVKEKGLEKVNALTQKYLENLKKEDEVVSAVSIVETEEGCVASQLVIPKKLKHHSPSGIITAVENVLSDGEKYGVDNLRGAEKAEVLCEYSLGVMEFMYEHQDRKGKIDVNDLGNFMKRKMTEKLADLVTPDLFVDLLKGL